MLKKLSCWNNSVIATHTTWLVFFYWLTDWFTDWQYDWLTMGVLTVWNWFYSLQLSWQLGTFLIVWDWLSRPWCVTYRPMFPLVAPKPKPVVTLNVWARYTVRDIFYVLSVICTLYLFPGLIKYSWQIEINIDDKNTLSYFVKGILLYLLGL